MVLVSDYLNCEITTDEWKSGFENSNHDGIMYITRLVETYMVDTDKKIYILDLLKSIKWLNNAICWTEMEYITDINNAELYDMYYSILDIICRELFNVGAEKIFEN